MNSIERKKILDEVLPALGVLMELQHAKMCQLEGKVSYALSKLLKSVMDINREYLKYKENLLKDFVNVSETGAFLTIKEEGKKEEYHWKSDTHKESYMNQITTYLKEKIYLQVHQVQGTLVEQCWNIPAQTLAMMQDLDMISDLDILKAGAGTLRQLQ